MSKEEALVIILLLLLTLSACSRDDSELELEATPPAESVATQTPVAIQPTEEIEQASPEAVAFAIKDEGVFISELLPGIPGNNNQEFIELYNAGDDAVNLGGWSLWYLLGTGQEEILIHAWDAPTDIPSFGHYLLVREGKEFGLIPDATFGASLFEGKGGLALRDASGETVDRLGWGDGPEDFMAGSPAPAPADGASLERLPGGEAGNGVNAGDNAADFVANSAPNPQNSGSPPTPAMEQRLTIDLQAPATVEPGAKVDYLLQVKNQTGADAAGVGVYVPVPAGFEIIALPDGAVAQETAVLWTIGELGDGDTASALIGLRSPFTYLDTLVSGYYVAASDGPRAYGPLKMMSISGGSIPIATARQLEGNEVTVEGVVTMYTGGFFAGSTGTKFYMEDETGGVQVYVPGGMNLVNVDIGDRLRVTGAIEVYRDSIELVPGDIPADVETLEPGFTNPVAAAISIADNGRDDTVLGRLNVVEGVVTRIEEFTFSYEVDLADDQGNTTLVYVEKDTGVTAEPLDLGKRYRVTGISEFYSGLRQIKPRLQSDFVEIFPPVLLLELKAANSVLPGELLTYTVTVFNHTPDPLADLQIEAALSGANVNLGQVLDGGQLSDGRVVWAVESLDGNGASTQLRYTVTVNEEAQGRIAVEPATVESSEWPEMVSSAPYMTFIGGGVPIWAVQGTGDASPYVRSTATTEGIVTGVFPELGGFWIQEPETDDDPATSAGLFVLVEGFEIPVVPGDNVRVTGRVRELSSQTTLHALTPEAIMTLSSGNPLPEPEVFDPPQESEAGLAYKEALEGMLVTVEGPAVAVAPTTQFGEYVLVEARWGTELVRRGEETGFLIPVDDGSSVVHEDQSTLAYAIQRGDQVTNLTGPLAYTFGQYKIEPINEPVVTHAERPLPAINPAGPNELTVATFNVENLFDLLDPHPSSPPKPSAGEYRLKLNKLSEAILAMGAPIIVGLQEVENIDVLEDLVEHEQLIEFDYVPLLIEGGDSRGIDVAYLVRGDRATVEGIGSYPAPEGITSRHPLLITTTVQLEASDVTVYVLNNHFTSLSEGEEATEPRRTAQAAWNATIVDQIRATDPAAHILVLGDLNSFYNTLPIETLQEAGLRHVYESFETGEPLPYTYIFEGASQTLDHILASEGLFERLSLVEALHIDADYPINSLEDASARRVSDHDPLIAVFSFESP